MDDVAPHLLLIALICLFVWFALTRSVFRILESEHPEVYREMDRPGVDTNFSKTTLAGLFRLIAKRGHKALANRALSWRCDLALVAYGAGFVLIAMACVFQWIL